MTREIRVEIIPDKIDLDNLARVFAESYMKEKAKEKATQKEAPVKAS